jgi:N-acetylneuraminic acid mutarotase
MSAISIGKWIVVTGGSNNEHIHIADSYVYDTEQNVWKGDIKCLKLNVARAEQTATVLGGDTIYIFGGNSNRNRLDSIEYISFKDLTGISINGTC